MEQWIGEGKIKIQPPTVFTFSEAAKAHKDMENRTIKGKLVFEV